MSRQHKRRYRKTTDRKVWVSGEVNQKLRPGQIARAITAAALEQARLEADAANERVRHDENTAAHPKEDTNHEVA